MVSLIVELEFEVCLLVGARTMASVAWKRPNARALGS
jgi:hypothetical protein